MKKLLFALALSVLCHASAQAQTTNTVPPKLKLSLAEGGVFVRYSAQVGRLYRLEESVNLTNWTLLEQKVADATNMSFYFENPNVNFTSSLTGGSTNQPGPLPSPSGAQNMVASQSTPTSDTIISRKPKNLKLAPLPYPWEEAYRAKPRDLVRMTAESDPGTTTTLASLSSPAPEAKFYRVVSPDNRIQFPNWMPFVDQFLNFDVWTSIAGGTYRMELYRDGVGVFTNVALVPASGNLRVYDPNYNAANWPFDGYYNVGEWELRVTVTPPASVVAAAPAQATVKKIQRRPGWVYRRGLTVNMAGPQYFGPDPWTTIETDFNNEMLFAFAAGFNGARQVTLDYTWRDASETQLQNLTTAADWTKLRALIFGTQPSTGLQLSDLHYTGHGNVDQIGIGTPGFNIRLAILQLPLLKTNPMAYVALDGCKVVAASTDMLSAFIGYTTNLTRLQCAGIGGIPAFAWGWKQAKPIGYLHQGVLFDNHWFFIDDYYDWLGRRDSTTGLLKNSYKSAFEYAKDPLGRGFGGSSLMHNSEGDDFTSVGCSGCYFDEF